MNPAIARGLIALNNRFYADHAASFSATRSAPWAGWSRLADELKRRGWDAPENTGRSVLDLACGNLRFERFLTQALPAVYLDFTAVDSCPELAAVSGAPGAPNMSFVTCHQLDILRFLLDGSAETPNEREGSPATPLPRPRLAERPYDLAVCFGFMHHVPGADLRYRLLDLLVDSVAPGGFIAISFWQFMDDSRLAAKAAHADACTTEYPPFSGFSPSSLDKNDHFLGWQEDRRPLRYCHHFDEGEIDALVAHATSRVRELVRWSADGSSGTLNRYLLLQRS